MKAKMLLLLVLGSTPGWLCAQTTVSIAPDGASREDVQKLFEVMASREQIHQMMQQVFVQMRALSRAEMKKQHPEITEAELAKADGNSQQFINNFPVEEMLNDMIPVYQRHFTKSDIEALTAFYSSSTGQKFLHEMPAVTAETMQSMYPKIQERVEAAMKQADQKKGSTQK